MEASISLFLNQFPINLINKLMSKIKPGAWTHGTEWQISEGWGCGRLEEISWSTYMQRPWTQKTMWWRWPDVWWRGAKRRRNGGLKKEENQFPVIIPSKLCEHYNFSYLFFLFFLTFPRCAQSTLLTHNSHQEKLGTIKDMYQGQKSPGWWSSMDWAQAWEPKGCWFDSQSGHMRSLQARSPVGGARETTTHWCFSHSLSPSLSLSLKINKIFFKKR